MAAEINNILIPNVTKTSVDKKVDVTNRLPKSGAKSEFNEILKQHQGQAPLPLEDAGIQLSTHAAKRLQERQIEFTGKEYLKVKEGIQKLVEKGGRNSLVVTNQAAYIVDVANNKVVTAIDKESMNENVFTKIDSTVFIN
jgi:flagellar operon protein